MTRKCKTPEKIRELLKRHAAQIEWVDEMMRVKMTVPVENQANHIREKSLDYFEGLADGANNLMEGALFEHNCYAGFGYIGKPEKHIASDTGESYISTPRVGPDHPDYAGWRRHYYTRGV